MERSPTPSILFVCSANIIRSPMAEALFKQKLGRFLSLQDWIVSSAGVNDLGGYELDENAQAAIKGLGVDLSNHVSRQLDENLINTFDLLLTMELEQKNSISAAYPQYGDKIFFLGDVADPKSDVPDPRSRPLDEYLAIAKDIQFRLENGFIKILLLAMRRSLERTGQLEQEPTEKPTKKTNEGIRDDDEIENIFNGMNDFPKAARYDLLLVLIQFFPDNPRLMNALKKVASLTPVPDYEARWLLEISYHEIVLPVTCRIRIMERKFIHPVLQDQSDQIKARITDPQKGNLHADLELLFSRKFNENNYRLHIWELSEKHSGLPYKIGDYVEAYRILRKKYHK